MVGGGVEIYWINWFDTCGSFGWSLRSKFSSLMRLFLPANAAEYNETSEANCCCRTCAISA